MNGSNGDSIHVMSSPRGEKEFVHLRRPKAPGVSRTRWQRRQGKFVEHAASLTRRGWIKMIY